jgi:hypothetical protein
MRVAGLVCLTFQMGIDQTSLKKSQGGGGGKELLRAHGILTSSPAPSWISQTDRLADIGQSL